MYTFVTNTDKFMYKLLFFFNNTETGTLIHDANIIRLREIDEAIHKVSIFMIRNFNI